MPNVKNAYTVTTDLHLIGKNVDKKIQIEYIDPATLKPNPWNSNRVGPDMEARLEASLKRFGFVKPVMCRKLPDGSLQIIGGEHRTRKAIELGVVEVPVVVLKNVDDQHAKALGLADNGRYGDDDALKLGDILRDLGEEFLDAIPFDEQDLAGIFAVADTDLDNLSFDDEDDNVDLSLKDLAKRAKPTHELMRFKVPIEDRESVEKFIQHVIKTKGLDAESDSMIAAGMALVELVNMAREVA